MTIDYIHHTKWPVLFNKLPFGISSAPEVFQKRMKKILNGLPGVVCMIDDILVFGADQKEHDERLSAMME